MKKLLLINLILFFSVNAFARTREQAIYEARDYQNTTWTVSINNINDKVKYIPIEQPDGKYIWNKIEGSTDAIDDRMGIYDDNENGILDPYKGDGCICSLNR